MDVVEQMTDDFSAYRNWNRERADFLFHYKDLHRRNDLLQKRLDEAQALIARMQTKAIRNGKMMMTKSTLGSVYRNRNQWAVRIKIDGKRFSRCGFKTAIEAAEWLRNISEAIGFDRHHDMVCSAKASMIAKLEMMMNNQSKEAAG